MQAKIKYVENAGEIVVSLLNHIAPYVPILLNMIMMKPQFVDIALPITPNMIKQFLSLSMINTARK